MELKEAKQKFVNAWGTLGSNWGINKTMAQVHALLMISADPMSADEIMEELSISRGNANMNVRALIDWGLVERVHLSGERREYFWAEKDIWKVFRQVAKERRKREVEPIFKVLEDVKKVKGDKKDRHLKAFSDSIDGIHRFATKTDKTLDALIKADEHWFLSAFTKLIK